jgi:peptidoglycan/xylan/chitin deacetylase (PgdA/CDA1 family)
MAAFGERRRWAHLFEYRVRVPGLNTARRTADWALSRLGTRTLVLGYHRIDDAADDPFGICTPLARFSRHLEILAEETRPIAMEELVSGLRSGALPKQTSLVTLDDGYADALHNAKPALLASGIPATVFVTTGLVDKLPWWESLAAAIPARVPLPEQFSIDVDGRSLGWSTPHTSRGERSARIQALHEALIDWTQSQRDAAIEKIAAELMDASPSSPVPRGLTSDELAQLSAGDTVEIGAHGVDHSLLASMSDEAQRFEIGESKRLLEAAVGRPLRAFSYPNGSNSARTRALVQEGGFACAFGSHSGVATPSGDAYCLPRFWAGKMEPDAFRRLVRYWR